VASLPAVTPSRAASTNQIAPVAVARPSTDDWSTGDFSISQLEALAAVDRTTAAAKAKLQPAFDFQRLYNRFRNITIAIVGVAVLSALSFEGGRFAALSIAIAWKAPTSSSDDVAMLTCTFCQKPLPQSDAFWRPHPRFPSYGQQPFHPICFELLNQREGKGSVAEINRRSFEFMGAFVCGCFAAVGVGVYYFSRT
jgi:hypothetical protein